MSSHSIAEAKRKLSNLIDRALEGKQVIITRAGRPVVTLAAISSSPSPLPPEALERLKRRRVGKRLPRLNAVAAVRSLRREWDR